MYGKNRSFTRVSIHGFNGFRRVLATLILSVAVSLSAQAQLTPGAPALLDTNATTDTGGDFNPRVTTDGAGNWVAVWYSNENLGGTAGTDNDIFVSRSTDNGTTWTAPALLATNGTADIGADTDPQVTSDGAGNWVAVWQSQENLGSTAGFDKDIFVATSTDNGATWTTTVVLNTNATTDSGDDINPQVTTDSAGNWVAVWESAENLGGTAGTDWDIFVSTSTDNGGTWTAPAILNTNATTDTGGDRFPQVTTDGGGNWVAVWHSFENLGGTAGADSDLFVAASTDNGATWTTTALLNTNGDSDTGADFVPQVTTDGAGNWVAAWYSDEDLGGAAGTDNDIFVSTSTNNGAMWTAPALLNTNGASDSGGDNRPQVTTDGAGNWVAVWDSDEDLGGTAGTDDDIFAAISTDNGTTWTAPALFNTNGVSDVGSDFVPQVTTDGVGNWVTAWYSTENLGGAGTDFDIFVSTFVFPSAAAGGGGGGCLVATAAYGTPMENRIDVLREARDTYLLNTAVGSAFVDAYYTFSPPIADFVAKHPAAATTVRVLLTPVIAVSGALWTLPLLAGVFVIAATSYALHRRKRSLLKA